MTKKLAAVAGMGISGQAAAKLLVEAGYMVVGFDQNTSSSMAAAANLTDLAGKVEIVRDADPTFLGTTIAQMKPELVVVSPGIPPHSPLFAIPAQAGIEIIGEVELAWRFSSENHGETKANAPSWLCITGTNGKTTTVSMLAAILRAAGRKAVAAGNVGYPITRAVAEQPEVLAVELSSFQLETTRSLTPVASVCLNLDVDHLDWHETKEAYWAAKGKVYDRVKVARFYFEDDSAVEELARAAGDAKDSMLVPLVFGDVAAGAIGISRGALIDRVFTTSKKGGGAKADLTSVPLLRDHLKTADGSQNPLVRDALAAAALALADGVTVAQVACGLSQFDPGAHRFAKVGTQNSVTWIDDSKATNVHAALAALRAVPSGSAVMIVGGDSKGQDLTPLVTSAKDQARGVVIIGADTTRLAALFEKLAPDFPAVVVCGVGKPESWMREVVRACAKMAKPGDTVMLAPACASWDQFTSYSQRGQVYQVAVEEEIFSKG